MKVELLKTAIQKYSGEIMQQNLRPDIFTDKSPIIQMILQGVSWFLIWVQLRWIVPGFFISIAIDFDKNTSTCPLICGFDILNYK